MHKWRVPFYAHCDLINCNLNLELGQGLSWLQLLLHLISCFWNEYWWQYYVNVHVFQILVPFVYDSVLVFELLAPLGFCSDFLLVCFELIHLQICFDVFI